MNIFQIGDFDEIMQIALVLFPVWILLFWGQSRWVNSLVKEPTFPHTEAQKGIIHKILPHQNHFCVVILKICLYTNEKKYFCTRTCVFPRVFVNGLEFGERWKSCPSTGYITVFEFNVFHGKGPSQVKILNLFIIMIFMTVILVTS